MLNDLLGSAQLDDARAVHIAPLSRETIIENAAEHLGFGGYFIFETDDRTGQKGIRVLAKVVSLEAAFAMLDIWREATSTRPGSQV